jgi:hypothetical protein
MAVAFPSGLRERYPPFHALRKRPPAYLLARQASGGRSAKTTTGGAVWFHAARVAQDIIISLAEAIYSKIDGHPRTEPDNKDVQERIVPCEQARLGDRASRDLDRWAEDERLSRVGQSAPLTWRM